MLSWLIVLLFLLGYQLTLQRIRSGPWPAGFRTQPSRGMTAACIRLTRFYEYLSVILRISRITGITTSAEQMPVATLLTIIVTPTASAPILV